MKLSNATGWIQGGLTALVAMLAIYFTVSYMILPRLWKTAERVKIERHPALVSVPKVTQNADGVAGGPLNVALVGDRADMIRAMLAAGWKPADPITFESSLQIAESVVFQRPDPNAPVSNLYVFGRRQDLAFELEIGASADRRHHVRWWKCAKIDSQGRSCWVGAVSLDVGSGVSHLTGQITHHVSPDMDAQRDQLMSDLNRAGQLATEYQILGLGPTRNGRNAGGDPYFTDGMLDVGVLKTAAVRH